MKIDGDTIAKCIDEGIWTVHRGDTQLKSTDLRINPNSVNVTLGPKLLFPRAPSGVVDPVDDPDSLQWHEVLCDKRGKFLLNPGEFCLAYARERFDVSNPIWIDQDYDEATAVPSVRSTSRRGHKVYCAPMYDSRSTIARIGLTTHEAGFGDYYFGGCFTLELSNPMKYGIVLTAGMQIGQLSFGTVSPAVASRPYAGAYASGSNGPTPPQLGRKRFMQE